jgi:hypothetical protein
MSLVQMSAVPGIGRAGYYWFLDPVDPVVADMAMFPAKISRAGLATFR